MITVVIVNSLLLRNLDKRYLGGHWRWAELKSLDGNSFALNGLRKVY